MPGIRFVDAANGVLGVDWVNGKSVRYLLGSGDEGEVGEDQAIADKDWLAEYEVSKGTASIISSSLFFFSLDGTRYVDGDGGHPDSEDAPGRYHTWRSDNIEHDVAPSIFSQ